MAERLAALVAWLGRPVVGLPPLSRAELLWAPGILAALALAAWMVADLLLDRRRLTLADDRALNWADLRLALAELAALAFWGLATAALVTDHPLRAAAFVWAALFYGWSTFAKLLRGRLDRRERQRHYEALARRAANGHPPAHGEHQAGAHPG